MLGPNLAELQYIDAMAGKGVHTIGAMHYRHTSNSTAITVGGSIASGDSASVIIASRAFATSTIAVNIASIDTLTSVATALAGLINSNTTFTQAGIYADSQAANVNVHQPGTLQPPFTMAVKM